MGLSIKKIEQYIRRILKSNFNSIEASTRQFFFYLSNETTDNAVFKHYENAEGNWGEWLKPETWTTGIFPEEPDDMLQAQELAYSLYKALASRTGLTVRALSVLFDESDPDQVVYEFNRKFQDHFIEAVNEIWKAEAKTEVIGEKDMKQDKIFISHSKNDEIVVKKVISFLEACMEIPDTSILCTSVPGYEMRAGKSIPDALRAEIERSLIIGILSPNSLKSRYVLFELGAAWGMRRIVFPLLLGIDYEDIPGPMRNNTALKATIRKDLSKLIEDTSGSTGFKKKNLSKIDDAITDLLGCTVDANEGKLIRADDLPEVYIIDYHKKRHIAGPDHISPENWKRIESWPEEIVNRLETGTKIHSAAEVEKVQKRTGKV